LLLNNKLLVEPLPESLLPPLQLKLLLLKSMSKLKLRPKLKLKPKLKYKLKLKHKLLQKLKLKLLLLSQPLSPRKLLFQTPQISIKLPLLLLPPLNLCQKRKHGLR